jgi:phosphohistidine phosphatase
MQLTLVRHGEAAPADMLNDAKRPLTTRGQQQAQQTAAYLAANIQPDVFVVSPLLRAQQTLGCLQALFPNVPVVICDAIKPEDDAKIAIEWLSYLPYESIVVVCHMNVVAHIQAKLEQESFRPFALAEARIFEQPVIAAGFSSYKKSFIPSL